MPQRMLDKTDLIFIAAVALSVAAAAVITILFLLPV